MIPLNCLLSIPYSHFKIDEALFRSSEKGVQQYLPIFREGRAICFLKRYLCVDFQGELLFAEPRWNLTL